MTSADEIKNKEKARLRRLGIIHRYIHITDGVPVVIVDEDMMDWIVNERDSGRWFGGRFVCDHGDGTWSCSTLDMDHKHVHGDGLTERLAYRLVLGYRIGREPLTSRYKGYSPKYRIRKDGGDGSI